MKTTLHTVFLLLISINIALSASSRNPQIDSLIKVKDTISDTCEKAWKYSDIALVAFSSDMKLSLKYINEGIVLAEKSKCSERLASLYVNKSIILDNMGQREASIKVIDQAISLYQNKVDKPLNLGKAYHSKGSALLNQDKITEALDNYLKALSIITDIDGDDDLIEFKSTVYRNMGGIYTKMSQLDTALYYINESVELVPVESDPIDFVEHHLNLSSIYKLLDSFDIAVYHLNKADSVNKIIDFPHNQIKINMTRAYIYSYLGKYEKAIALVEKTKPIVNNSQDFRDAHYQFFSTSSKIYYKVGKYEQGIKVAKEYLEGKGDDELLSKTVNLTQNLYLCYEALGDYKNALVYFKAFKKQMDVLSGEKTLNEINRLKEEYESEKKGREIALLKEKDKTNQLEINKKENEVREQKYLVLILTLLVVSLIIGFLFYRKSQSLKKEKVKRKLEQQVFRTQMNPHFIFNSLNSIQRMYVEGNTDEANDFLTEFSGLIRNILENSNHDKIALNEEINTLKSYLELEKLRTKDKFDFTIDIDESIDQYNYKVPPLVIQPFVENAIWHGILPGDRKGEIQIKLTKVGNRIHVEVMDNGVGFITKNTEKHESHGIKITEKRIGSKVNIESSAEGTKIDFTI